MTGALIGGLMVLVGIVAAYFKGRSTKTTKEAQSRADTFERVQDADIGTGASDADTREWLQSRGRRKRP